MANKRRWSRYRPPSERRNETGQPVAEASAGKAGASRPKQATRPAARQQKATKGSTASKGSHKSWAGFLAMLAIVAVIVGIVIAARAGGDDDTPSDLETELLTTEFIGESLDRAIAEEGKLAVSVRVTEYGVTVEYFDPNERESRYFETNSYTDGYRLRVEETHYEDYQPRPFDITVLDPARIVEAVEDAIAQTDDPYTFSLTASADRDSGEVTMVTNVGGDESVDLTRGP